MEAVVYDDLGDYVTGICMRPQRRNLIQKVSSLMNFLQKNATSFGEPCYTGCLPMQGPEQSTRRIIVCGVHDDGFGFVPILQRETPVCRNPFDGVPCWSAGMFGWKHAYDSCQRCGDGKQPGETGFADSDDGHGDRQREHGCDVAGKRSGGWGGDNGNDFDYRTVHDAGCNP
jgi:hypothetical protein